MSIKLFIGLGNAGTAYVNTRHNAGVILLTKLAESHGIALSYNKYCAAYTARVMFNSKPVILAFVDGFMNNSGSGLNKILKFYSFKTDECAVMYDDISMDIGRFKIAQGGSSGGHNGIADIISKCGDGFVRLKIGIGAKPDKRMDLADYVLSQLSSADMESILKIDIRGCADVLLSKGLEACQNIYNRRAE